jgi:hypothetical protein
VKGVTVSRGPGIKRGPEITKTKEKFRKFKNSLILGPKFAGFWGPDALEPWTGLFSLYKSKFASGKGAQEQ